MTPTACIVVGLGFGDEGKGLATDYLCGQSPGALVVRFNGGHQAGHTVVAAGQRHVFSNFGAGTLRGAPTYWSPFCTFSPGSVLNEYAGLQALGTTPRLLVDRTCPVTTHYDVLCNRLAESARGLARHGSCGLGFGATVERHEHASAKLYAQDLLFPEITAWKLKGIRQYYQSKMGAAAFEPFDHDAEDARFLQSVEALHRLRERDVVQWVRAPEVFSEKNGWSAYVFEGAQGVLLDMDFGFFPHVTRSHTTARNALRLIDEYLKPVRLATEIWYVTRAYQTRHGAGPMTHEGTPLALTNHQHETNQYNEHQGHLRVSPLDLDLLRYARQCDETFSHGLRKNLLVTCLDQLPDGLIPCFERNHPRIVAPGDLPALLGGDFVQTRFSYSACGEQLGAFCFSGK